MNCLKSILPKFKDIMTIYFKVEHVLHPCLLPSNYRNLSASNTMQTFSFKGTFQGKYIENLHFDERELS